MCGIAGLIRPGGARGLGETAAAMATLIAHRGPDGHGLWCDEAAGIALSHRRLAIQDLSEAGAQPMSSACGRWVTVYNGEIYNAPALSQELSAAGHSFRGHSDTEVLLAAIAEWGLEAALGRAVGMFAIALWDRQRRELALVRDRLGIKPVFWAAEGGGLVFGSELKAVLAGLGARPAVDRAGLAAYLRHGWIPAPLTIHQGIAKLEPGSILRFRPGEPPRLTRFWSLPETLAGIAPAERIADPEEGRALIERTLTEAVRLRLLSDVPVGAFLSGGIDSSLITALMQEVSPNPVHSYSIGSPDRDYDEARFAREIAARLGTRHTELTVGEADCLAVVPELTRTYDEPFADSSQVPSLVLSRLARQHVTVALSGDGGDELFAGYNRHLWLDRAERLRQRVPGWALNAGLAVAEALPAGAVDALGRAGGIGGAARRFRKLRALLAPGGPGEAHQGALAQWTGLGPERDEAPLPAYAAAEALTGFSGVERMQAIDLMSYLPDDILTKVDRASMAHALEVRVPFLDHRVVRAAFRLAPGLKLRGGTTKWILREMLSARLPRELFQRPKMGFAIPLGGWLRNELRDWAGDLIGATDWKGLGISAEPIRDAWRRHQSAADDETDRLWTAVMLADWAARGGASG